MRNYTKRLITFFMAFAVLISSMNVIISVLATGADIRFELNGGQLAGSSSGFAAGDALPDCEKVTRDGAVFGGWYADADFNGERVFTVPAGVTGQTVYYARWINHDVNCESFESYVTNDELNAKWLNWAENNASFSLNTDSAHANSGKSVKIDFAKANANSNLAFQDISYSKTGNGVAFWTESKNGATVKFILNGNISSAVRTFPGGKHMVTIPWTELKGALDAPYLWKIQLVVKVPNAGETVYIDDIGTYTDISEGKLIFNTNGGAWAKGFNPPENYKSGTVLPGVNDISRAGAVFGGWYTDADFSGAQIFTVPADATGEIVYYARWIICSADYDNFESYATDADLLKKWSDWKWPAQNAATTLNTNPAHAYSGKSMKNRPNEANKNDEIVLQASFSRSGNGISFWIESDGATVQVLFNHMGAKSIPSPKINVPSGKYIVAIPWSKIEGALQASDLWQLSLLINVPESSGEVYIDDVGTYTDYTEGKLTFDTSGGTWADGFTPTEKYTPGTVLPVIDNISRAGYAFAGWFDNTGFTGSRAYTVPDTASGDITYYARWIKIDPCFSDFEKYTDTSVITTVLTSDGKNSENDKANGFITEEDGKGGFYFWSGVQGTTVQLNASGKNVSSGSKSAKLVLKVKGSASPYNSTHFGSDRVFFPNEKDLGEGVSFWISTDKEIKLRLRLNNNTDSAKITVPAGKHYITVPWKELQNKRAPWITLICFDNPSEEATVYIDDIGTYTVAVDNKVMFNLNGGECIEGYILPVGYNRTSGITLPDCNQVINNGLTLAGWYDNAELKGTPIYSIPPQSEGDKEYWAKWILHDVNFDNFESYDTDDDLLNDNHWSDWKWPAQKAETSLNTDAAHAHNGTKSMKVSVKEANKEDQLVVSRQNFRKSGDGVAFWIESARGAAVRIQFNGSKTIISAAKSIPAGRLLVTIPWSEIPGAESAAVLWQTSLRVSVPNAEDTVYIDEIGTYKENAAGADTVSYYLLGGSRYGSYTAPTKYSSGGIKLPTYENVVKQGYTFAGWYDNKDYNGNPITVTPESGSVKLYAKWIKHTAGFDDFESYTDSIGWEARSNSASPSLNTDAANAYDGSKSLKLGVAGKDTHKENYAAICKNKVFYKAGDGVSFSVKSQIAATLLVAFNDQNKYYEVAIPAGKSIVTVPWEKFTSIAEGSDWWCMFLLVKTADKSIANTVYIDSIGTYSDSTDRILTYNLNGGEFVAGASVADELDGEKTTVLPTDKDVQKEGFFFAGWYANASLTGTPIFGLEPDNTANREFWAKWVEQVNINHDFENFDNDEAVAKALWEETTPYENWRESGSVYLYLEKDSKNLAPGSTKGLRAEYEVLDGEYIKGGSRPSACFRNYSWSTTFGKRGTDREGDGFKFWIKTDRTITIRVSFLIGGDPKKGTTAEDIVIPANESGVTVCLPWSYIKETDAKTLASMGISIYDSVGTKGTVWIDELGIYYNEKMVDFVAENDDKDIKITGYNNHIPKGTKVEIKKYQVNKLTSLGGELPTGVNMAYLAEYKLLNDAGGSADIYGPAWVSFKRPKGADVSKIGVYEVFLDGSLDSVNYTVEGDWITVYSLNPTAMLLVTTNDTDWSAKGITIDTDVIQKLTATVTVVKQRENPQDSTDGTAYGDNGGTDIGINTDNNTNASTGIKRGPKRGPKTNNSKKTDDDGGSSAWIIILISVGAAAVACAGIIIPVAIKRKRGKNNGGAK